MNVKTRQLELLVGIIIKYLKIINIWKEFSNGKDTQC